MSINSKPADQPRPDDVSDFKDDGDAGDAPATDSDAAAEEEAARLGDFA